MDEFYDDFFPGAVSTADYADYRNDMFSISAVAGTWDGIRRALESWKKSAESTELSTNICAVNEILNEIYQHQE